MARAASIYSVPKGALGSEVDGKVQGSVLDLIGCLDTQSESCHPHLQLYRAFGGVMLPAFGRGKSSFKTGNQFCSTWTALPHAYGHMTCPFSC